jgi:hypothetical protein
MTERDWRFADKIEIPEVGEFEVIDVTDDDGCVDPRKFLDPRDIRDSDRNPYYKRTPHLVGAVRSPGATFGKAMSLLGAVPDLPPEEAIETVSRWAASEGRTFSLHEDDHHHDDNELGCGHIDRASREKNEPLYGIPSRAVRAMRDFVRRKVRSGEIAVEAPKLTGTHKEEGVLIVRSKDKTVVPITGESEFFRFDETRHDDRLKRLARFAQQDGIPAEEDKLLQAAERQRNATLELLAPNRPVYEVDLRDGRKTVTYKGRIKKQFE